VAPLLTLATKLLRAGRPAEAMAPLRKAAILGPSNANIQHDLGLAYLEAGHVPDAIAALQWAVASNPRHADAPMTNATFVMTPVHHFASDSKARVALAAFGRRK